MIGTARLALVLVAAVGILFPCSAQDICDLIRSSDLVVVGDAVSATSWNSSILSKDGSVEFSPQYTVEAKVTPRWVIKGAASGDIKVLGEPPEPEMAGFHRTSADGAVLLPGERSLLFLVRPTEAGHSGKWGVIRDRDEETRLAVPSAGCYGFSSLFTRHWLLRVPIPTSVALPPSQATPEQSVALLLARCVVAAGDQWTRWDYLGLLRDLGTYTRLHAAADGSGQGRIDSLRQFVLTTVVPLLEGWASSRPPLEQAGTLEALLEMGDTAVTDAYLSQIRDVDAKETDGVGQLTLAPLEQIAQGKNGVAKLLPLLEAKTSRVRRCVLQALRALPGKDGLRVPAARAAAKKLLTDADRETVLMAIWYLVDYDRDYQHGPAVYHPKAGQVPEECLNYWLDKK